jgi:hypothetical protein
MEEGDEEEVEEARIDGGDVVRLRFCTGRDDFEILADKTLHEATLLVIVVDNDDAMELGKKTKAKEARSERVARRGLLGDSIVVRCSKMLQRKDCFAQQFQRLQIQPLLKLSPDCKFICVEHQKTTL